MINKNFLESLKDNYKKNETERREIISASNGLLFESKKIIFKLQREEFKEAQEKFLEVEKSFKSIENEFTAKRLKKEGAYKAAAEEYLEAKTFYQTIKETEITEITSLDFDYESYFGGICDLIGELVRYATNQATKGKFKEVSKIKTKADDIMSQLIDIDMTGYLRTKYDQARGHLRKLEQMAYEIKIKTGK
jgi:predicted translin family RNA/ssDNA-binding protein